MTELEGRVALAKIDLEKARLLATAARAIIDRLGRPVAGGPDAYTAAVAHGLAVLDVRAAEVKLAVAESALARSLS